MRADLTRRWDCEGMPVENITKLLDVSKNTVYRYLGPGWKKKRRQAGGERHD